MNETQKSIVITGSSSGFGQKSVKDFADKGYLVFATMRGPEGKNAAVKAELEAYSDSIQVVDMDVTNDDSVKTAIASVLDKAGKIDVLLNNAGVMYLGITEAFSIDQAREQMETNYYGAMRTILAVLPAMREAKSGLIINTSSMVGQISAPYFSTYAATKHALEGYLQGLRYEVAPFGIDVAIVQPGPFPTGLSASGQQPSRTDILDSYGELANIPTAMFEEFGKFMQSDQAPNPQMVVDAYLALADMPKGKRPTRTAVGLVWGVDEINAAKQPIQDRVLTEMQLDKVLGGVDV
ncbi:MAG: NAD(P)-dependent dehydrogenase (short-subunit alcohol dehydrogenase family) [Pseudoalteromonas rhizosphaerae]|jgi:NAD(P)-dependent dehydrogenase (short-subunit alcohol dehydrogenase family)|uniref:SDR family oxidoreductase n=2 Tax=Pseudoalteromonas TaxID=53246 RepID=A0ABY3FER6_9GAMM|nr:MULTISPECIES: SDR family oxidoreductase [Pseudoalteromonas]MBB1303042.1 SDR family oxidoreductase [Pseudoalteromonas sp. SR44-8]MBE0456947.1 SDR family oxidoreductase [Pseudoalteromonas prydzensis]TVU84154.1 SDR family oxidoreductase [Pseudoalteromonas neustonica]WKD25381.1 SDR family oxidoreductase [Pseudoalteromonas sp. KG3]